MCRLDRTTTVVIVCEKGLDRPIISWVFFLEREPDLRVVLEGRPYIYVMSGRGGRQRTR